MSVDHVVVAVPDLDAAVRDLQKRGVVCTRGGRHPAHGTHNALARIGADMFMEVLAADPNADSARRSTRGVAIAAVQRATVHELILREPDEDRLDAVRRICDVGEPRVGRRVNERGPDVSFVLTPWRTRGGTVLPELIRWTSERPGDALPASNVRARLRWSHPQIDDVLAALAAVGASDVEGARGEATLSVELFDADGSTLISFDDRGPM
jgi:hypothetical protein